MIDEKTYEKFMRHATKKQLRFISKYCDTLDSNEAFDYAGYNYNDQTRNSGRYRVMCHLWPYIQYRMQKIDVSPSKEWIILQWIRYVEKGDLLSQNALKEISKLGGFYEPENKIEINNNIPQMPVVISFNDTDNDNDK